MELEVELKAQSLWQKAPPTWVNHFEEEIILDGNGFVLWLQYVFIPNHLQREAIKSNPIEKKHIVPNAIKFFGNDIRKGSLLQILLELDALI